MDPLYTSQPISLRFILIPSFHPYFGLPSGLFPSGFHGEGQILKILNEESDVALAAMMPNNWVGEHSVLL
jgi:hypothetical protein